MDIQYSNDKIVATGIFAGKHFTITEARQPNSIEIAGSFSPPEQDYLTIKYLNELYKYKIKNQLFHN